MPISGDIKNIYQEIVFQLNEEEPDLYALGVLFSLSLMSFTYAAPRGSSYIEFVQDEDWRIEYFLDGLRYENQNLCFKSDYVSGRLMKTDITFKSGGHVTIRTRNRGKGAERWLLHLQGKRHIRPVQFSIMRAVANDENKTPKNGNRAHCQEGDRRPAKSGQSEGC
jgi:hypothetical protein